MNLFEQYIETRNYTEQLCKPLCNEDYGVQIVEFASPTKWHLAHTTWFFETFVLSKYLNGYQLFNKDFSFLFNSYYNNVGNRIIRTNRGNLTRPSIESVYEYRKYIDNHIETLLSNSFSKELKNTIVLGMNHEQQHQELILTDLKYMLGNNPLFPEYEKSCLLRSKLKNDETGWLDINAGLYKIGFDGNSFCFDNELGVHKVYLNNFSISKSLITNKEYIEFIEDGAYENFNLWLDEAWHWIQKNNIKAPLYWHKLDNVWHSFTLEGLKKINLNEPVMHLSFYEAAAFAEWKNMRLPTEFEWEIAADKIKWGQCWEWTHSAYLPYPNFKKAAGAIGEYNGKFMINQMVLRGSSFATSKNHSRKTYRNFFHANTQWQFTGIRLVQ